MKIDIFCRTRGNDIKSNYVSSNKVIIKYNLNKKNNSFIINKLWNNNEDNNKIFNELNNKSNYNVNYWIAFGYTGSGKTYTTTGLLENLLEYYKNSNITISAYQIYNEKIYDLLNKNKTLTFYKTETLKIVNKTRININNTNNNTKILNIIKNNRIKASTIMNNVSSRSHAIYELDIDNKIFIIVDMAGQESSITGKKQDKIIQKQATNINLNMLCLKECINKYKKKENFIPFRRCLLTLALKPLFNINCYVSFICNLNTSHTKYYQMDSLRYAASLYNNDKNNDNNYYYFFNNFTKYIQETGWFKCEERKIWMEMKKGNYSNINKINGYIEKQKLWLDFITNILEGNKKIHPEENISYNLDKTILNKTNNIND